MGLLSSLDIGSSLTNITGILNQYIVGPAAAFGLGGFVFNAEGEAMARLAADITDHYAEDNQALQDQIAIRPKRITLKGYVGELIYNGPEGGQTTLNTLVQKLTEVSSYLPTLASAATQAQAAITSNTLPSALSLIAPASNIYGLVKNTLGAFGQFKNQQNAYDYFEALMESKTIMSVQTPWKFFTSMAIETVDAVQPENSRWITDFSVTLKIIRIASTSTVAFTQGSNASATGGIGQAPTLSGVSAVQAAPVANLGPVSGAVTSTTPATLSNPALFGPAGAW